MHFLGESENPDTEIKVKSFKRIGDFRGKEMLSRRKMSSRIVDLFVSRVQLAAKIVRNWCYDKQQARHSLSGLSALSNTGGARYRLLLSAIR